MVPWRDALSILDTCAGVDNKVDEALVRRMAGVTDRGYLFEISDAIADPRDSVSALEKISALRQQSVDMRRQVLSTNHCQLTLTLAIRSSFFFAIEY